MNSLCHEQACKRNKTQEKKKKNRESPDIAADEVHKKKSGDEIYAELP